MTTAMNEEFLGLNETPERVEYLRSIAPLFPKVAFHNVGNQVYCNAMVVFQHNGQDYLRHHIESKFNPYGLMATDFTWVQNKLCERAFETERIGVPIATDEKTELTTKGLITQNYLINQND